MADPDLARRLATGDAVVAGVLSGTSADGVDVALVRVALDATGAPVPAALVRFETCPFPDELGARLRAVLDGGPCGLRATALLHRDLGRAFGRAAVAVGRAAGVPLALVGSHGQTVWHHDGAEPSGGATLQLGDGDFVAEEAGCAVVSDFRQRDLAAGGEGAPLVALVDAALYAAVPRPLAVLNLGGIANVTALADGPPRAFDVGPAGSLLDGLARRFLGAPYDRDGASAARGRPDEALVAALGRHPFFDRRPPKSTGRETFGEAWIEGVVLPRARELGVLRSGDAAGREDVHASAAAFVAQAVAAALERFVEPAPARLVVAGGGVHHRPLLRALEQALPFPVGTSDLHGVPADAREAMAFALLAAEHALGRSLELPAVTGARAPRCLGKWSPSPRERRPDADRVP